MVMINFTTDVKVQSNYWSIYINGDTIYLFKE